MSGSGELCVSVYLTMVFSNKMKGLLIVILVSVFVFTSSDSETAGAVKH